MLGKDDDKILVVSPHISDAVMMAGGSISKWKDSEREVFVCSLGPDSCMDMDNEREAGKILGFNVVEDVERFKVGEYNVSSCCNEIKKVVKKLKPDIVITVSNMELQNDHKVVNTATRDAVYYGLRELWWDKKERFNPLLYVTDCMESFSFVRADEYEELKTKHLQMKDAGMLEYDYVPEEGRSPFFDVIHDRQWIYALSKLRGLWVGCDAAEVFQKEEL